MTEQQAAELIDHAEIIKWSLICIAVSLWGITAYMLLRDVTHPVKDEN